jgi:hypothetical protein
MPRKRRTQTVGEWMELVSLVPPELAASSALLQHTHNKLRETLDEVQRLTVERDSHQAKKQAASARIQQLMEQGSRTASTVRAILREHFGPTSEELTAFKIQPFRGRKRAKKSATPEPSSGEPGE